MQRIFPELGRVSRLAQFVLSCILLFQVATVSAGGATVASIESQLRNDVHYLDARIQYGLTAPMLDALHKGVPLTFVLEIEISRQRNYVWDVTVAELEQRYLLEYHAVTQNYHVKNLNSGASYSLPSLDIALSVLGTIVDLPLLDDELLDSEANNVGRLRVQMDIEELPVPLRLLSYFSSEWHISSEWVTWSLQP